MKIHQGAVYCCRFSQDASKVVSCGADKAVKVWFYSSGTVLRQSDCQELVESLCVWIGFIQVGLYVQEIKFNVEQKVEEECQKAQQNLSECRHDKINVFFLKTAIQIYFKVWESQSGKELLSLTGHSDAVYCCTFSSNDARIVSCSADHTVKVWILH